MECVKESAPGEDPGKTLAMASFPSQKWCEPYAPEAALCQGTLFPCLNLKFHGTEGLPCSFLKNAAKGDLTEREEAMNQISAVGFAINDLTLYLDTHPDCSRGIALLQELLKKRLEGLVNYAAKYVPLTQLSMVTRRKEEKSDLCYAWNEGPAPWEGGLV